MQVAITRAVSPSIIHCELTHLERQPINIDLATEQHAAYEAALTDWGVACAGWWSSRIFPTRCSWKIWPWCWMKWL